jgi:lysozyme
VRIDENGVELIKLFEGFRALPYYDVAGYPTVGYGHLLSKEKGADLDQWLSVTEREADVLLRRDVARFERAVSRLVRVPLSQGQFNALVSFTYNLGPGALQASTLRRVINRGMYHEAPRQFRRWVYARGRKWRGLVKRREAEVLIGRIWEQP